MVANVATFWYKVIKTDFAGRYLQTTVIIINNIVYLMCNYVCSWLVTH